ncbi:MAG: Panacea domain-containing protein [Patescibacteria group bacterium]
MPLAKLKAILLYFCANTDQKFLGKVKLMKLFYFLDFTHVKKYGMPVTFDNYVNLEHGPIPSTIKNLVDAACDDADNSVLADVIYCERSEESMINRILPKRNFSENDKKYFSKSELDVLEVVCMRFGARNTKYIEDASHKESPWKKTKLLDNIPYSLAIEDKDCVVSREEISLFAKIYSD